jgi:hypothetical protein
MCAASHLLDDHKRTKIEEVCFTTTGRARSADCAIDIKSGAENRRITEASGNFPRQSAGGCDAADLASRVDAVAVDRAVQVLFAQFSFREHLERDAVSGFGAFLRIEIVTRICATFPLQPLLARVLSVEIVFDLESHVARKLLRAFADDQMVIGVFHHCFRHERRRPHTFERADGAGAFLRTMHARMSRVARRRQHLAVRRNRRCRRADRARRCSRRRSRHRARRRPGHHGERLLHRGHIAAVFEPVAIGGRDDQRFDGALFQNHRKKAMVAQQRRLPVTMKSRRFIFFVMVSSLGQVWATDQYGSAV